MKKFKLYIIALLCFLFFTDCENQLDLAPLGELSEASFYQTEKDFEAASLSPYSTLLNLYWNAYDGFGKMNGILMQDDDMIPSNNNGNRQEDFDWNNDNNQFSYLWGELYKGVQRSNVIIDRLPHAKGFINESNKARFEAEAKFLRGYFNFMLALNWGTPPVITSAITDYDGTRVANSEPGEIWDVVISDLTYAKENLPLSFNANNVGRATKGAATALLGKVYLHRAQLMGLNADYGNAINQFNEVINSGQYALVEDYSHNFSKDHENNPESIFEVQFEEGINNNQWLATDFGTPGNQDVGSPMSGRVAFMRPACGPTGVCAIRPGDASIGNVATSPSLMAAIEPGDPRRPHIFFMEGDPYMDITFNSEWSVSGSTPSKYVKGTPIIFPPISDVNNDRILRYADVLLMLAEAKLLANSDVGGAAELINQVRLRADPTGLLLIPRSTSASKDQMFEWLMHERRIELAFEGWRYYDLVRWHTAGLINIATDIDFGRSIANTNWNPRHLIKPIPLRDIELNPKLNQNPGYN